MTYDQEIERMYHPENFGTIRDIEDIPDIFNCRIHGEFPTYSDSSCDGCRMAEVIYDKAIEERNDIQGEVN